MPAATKIDRIRHRLGFGLVSWGNNSSGLKIGPATSCGKNKTYDANDAGPILYLILFLYVSTKKAINVNVINDIPSGIAIEPALSGRLMPINDEKDRNKKSKYLKKSSGVHSAMIVSMSIGFCLESWLFVIALLPVKAMAISKIGIHRCSGFHHP